MSVTSGLFPRRRAVFRERYPSSPGERSAYDARTALSPDNAAAHPREIGVFWRKLVAVDAMRLTGIRRHGRYPPKYIDAVRNSFEVVWVDAQPDTAEVVDGESCGYEGHGEAVRGAVGKVVLTATEHAPVAIRALGATP